MRFELLYAKYGPAVKAYVQRRADPSVADDVVAEVFIVCWRRFDEVPPDPLPWLLGIARRVLSTQRRTERRRSALRERLTQTTPGSADAMPALQDGAVAAALRRLRASDRELLLLVAWDGLSPAQAAVVLHVRPSTVRVRLLRARRRLAHLLSTDSPDSAPSQGLRSPSPIPAPAPAPCSSPSMEVSS